MEKQSEDHTPLLEPYSDDSAPSDKQKSAMRWNAVNVVLMGLIFFLMFTAFSTTQSFLTSSIGDTKGNIILFTIYGALGISGFISPYVVNAVGPKYGLLLGALTYLTFELSTLVSSIYAQVAAATLLGFGASVLWTAQGVSMQWLCTDETKGLYGGLFWGMFQGNLIVGNLAIGVMKQYGVSNKVIFASFSCICGLGVALILLLRIRPNEKAAETSALPKANVVESVWKVIKLLASWKYILISFLLVYTGLSSNFFWGPWPTLITRGHEDDNSYKKYVGYVFCVSGVAEVAGGAFHGFMSDRIGAKPVILTGAACHVVFLGLSFYLSRHEDAHIWLYFVSALFFGLGDSGIQSQVYKVLGSMYPDDNETPFASFKILQSLGSTFESALAFGLYSAYGKYYIECHIYYLAVVVVVGSVAMLFVSLHKPAAAPAFESLDSHPEEA